MEKREKRVMLISSKLSFLYLALSRFCVTHYNMILIIELELIERILLETDCID